MITIDELKVQLNNKSRLIGIDMGTKRIGVSICDENRKIATPYKTVDYTGIKNFTSILKKIIIENNIKGIIFGLPLNMDGTEGPSSQSAKDMAINLSKDISKPITMWDERLSSHGAFNLTSNLDVNTSKKLKKIDIVGELHQNSLLLKKKV